MRSSFYQRLSVAGLLTFGLLALVVAGCDSNDDADGSSETLRTAIVQVAPTSAPGSNVNGTIQISETEASNTLAISGSVSGLTEGDHGMHLHAVGDCSAADTGDPDDAPEPGGAAGPHYDADDGPDSAHGAPEDEAGTRHFGDFGNVTADAGGTADFETTVERPEGVSFGSDVAGRAVIVHSGRDDLETDPGGASGSRLGCGLVEEQDDD